MFRLTIVFLIWLASTAHALDEWAAPEGRLSAHASTTCIVLGPERS